MKKADSKIIALNPLDGLITRTAWCPRCYDAKRPGYYDSFVVYGSSSKQFKKFDRTVFGGKRGFTPHFFIKDKTIDDKTISFEKLCTIHECGINIIGLYEVKWSFEMFGERVQRGIMRIADWNGLLRFHDPLYLI